MKELPSIYANIFDKKIDNSLESITIKNSDKTEEKKYTKYEISKKIDKIFKSTNYIYKIKVEITLKNNIIEKTIVGKTSNKLITIDNETINLNDILDIKIKNL